MSNFRPINRDTGFLLPPSVDEWLPQRHLARFVVEVIDGLDLSELVKDYRGSGSASYHPALLLGLMMYGYATKVFSSRALERATYDSVAFRFIAGNEHPDHDTIAAFRKRFIGQIEPLFIEVLKLARTLGMLKLGTVALDGTKVHANASRHSALSYGVTTAYYLSKRGHDIMVIDRKGGAARETSFANGALLTPSMPEPWNAPGCWRMLLTSLGRSDSTMQIRLRALPGLIEWGAKFLSNSRPALYERNTLSNLHLALHSLEVMKSLRQEISIEYGRSPRGSLRVFRTEAALAQASDVASRRLSLVA